MMTLSPGANTVILTLTEKCTLDSPVFLFELKNDTSKELYYFIAADISDFPDRYNKFTITEKTSPNNLNGEVNLVNGGYYHYTVYEQSTTNLDPDLATGIVETGKCKFITSSTDPTEYSRTITNTVYAG